MMVQSLSNPDEGPLMRMAKWDYRFLELARLVASWSKDPSTQTGAVIVRPDLSIAATGFNGFPRPIKDWPALLEDREKKYSRIIHCEMNAVLHSRERLDGYTLYTWPIPCCDRCAVHMIQAGITRVVAPAPSNTHLSRWAASFDRATKLFHEAEVETMIYGDFK